MERRPGNIQNIQGQTTCVPDAAARDSRVCTNVRTRYKEVRTDFPLTTCDLYIVQAFTYYQHGAWDLGYSKDTKSGGAFAGLGHLRLRRPVGRHGVVMRRQEVRSISFT